MATKTDFLRLTLPALHEFLNSWHTVVNNNFETIDDWTSDLYQSMVGTSDTSTWASLRGSFNSLAERLATAINNDGSINLADSPDILALATSDFDGDAASPVARFAALDRSLFDARPGLTGSRFDVAVVAGTSEGSLVSLLALLHRDYGFDSTHPLGSPSRPAVAGLNYGAASLLSATGSPQQVFFMAGSTPAIFQIDGYLFRVREQINLDFSNVSVLTSDYIWYYVERVEANYNSANFLYAGASGSPVQKDLRKLQTGAVAGSATCSGNVLTCAGATFNTSVIGKVKPGDILVVTSGAATGSYAIDALDGTTPDVKLTVRGTFRADVTIGTNWYILDQWHPNIGCEKVADAVTLPPYVAGRVYIGRSSLDGSKVPTNVVTFAKNGVYDSGWTAATAATYEGGWQAFAHNLGVVPSRIDIHFRKGASDPQIYDPLVVRTVVTDTSGPVTATFPMKSIRSRADFLNLNLRSLTVSTSPSKAAAFFTDDSGTDISSAEIRVIARR